MLGQILKQARESSHLDLSRFAELVEVSEEQLTRVERNELDLTAAEADRCAQLFGVRLRDLLAGEATNAPMTLLLRSVWDEGRPSLDELEAYGAHRTLGEFSRCVRDVAELERLLGHDLQRLPQLSPSLEGFPAEREALDLRAKLGLGLEPVPSMRALLSERLGVQLFWSSPDDMDPRIDGASTADPRPTILVNLVGGGACWWRTRMTLAHELAHLLFDQRTRRALLSPNRPPPSAPRGGSRWQLFSGFLDMEAHADAFAACFLAPAAGVRAVVGSRDPSSEEAIGLVGARFGVGRTVAINRLQHSFVLSRELRFAMDTRSPLVYSAAGFEDDRVDEGIGLRAGVLVQLARTALERALIGRSRCREYLGRSAAEPLPFPDMPNDIKAPLLSPADVIRRYAQRYIIANSDRTLHPMAVELSGDNWRVEIMEGDIGESNLDDAGYLILNKIGCVLEDKIKQNKTQ